MEEQKQERKPATTFVVALPQELRRKVRIAAAVRDQTISEFVRGVVVRELERDQEEAG